MSEATTTTTTSEKAWLTMAEVAERLGVDVRTVKRLVAGQELGSYKVGAQRRISVGDFEGFLLARHAIGKHSGASVNREEPWYRELEALVERKVREELARAMADGKSQMAKQEVAA